MTEPDLKVLPSIDDLAERLRSSRDIGGLAEKYALFAIAKH